MPLTHIVHVLSNEPYCMAPNQVLDLTVNEVAMIMTDSKPAELTHIDAARFAAKVKARLEQEKKDSGKDWWSRGTEIWRKK